MTDPPSSKSTDRSLAAVFSEPDQGLTIRSIALPSLEANEALIKIECCTICGSDLHTFSGMRQEATPSILGHEIVGVVHSVGNPPLCSAEGRPLEPGDRVTWSVCVSCGSCDRCLRGLEPKCRHIVKYGHALAEGRTALSGGLAEYILLRAGTAVFCVDDELPAELICPANCATATVAAAYRLAGSIQQRHVLILGAGMLGLTAAAFAKSHGAESVTICDPHAGRLARATLFGADHAVCLQTQADFAEQIRQASNNMAFDIVLELSGAPSAVEVAVALADIGGQVVLVGSVMPTEAVAVEPQEIVRRWLTIQGVHNYAPQDLQTAIQFLTTQTDYPFVELVEQTFSLAEVNQAFAQAMRDRPVRLAIRP